MAATTDQAATWDLSDLYPDIASWEAACKELTAAFLLVPGYEHTLGKDAASFGRALTAVSEARRMAERVMAYAELSADVDLRDAAAQERRQRADELQRQLDLAIAWFEPGIRALGRKRVEDLLSASPDLERFRHVLDNVLRLEAHEASAGAATVLVDAEPILDAPKIIYQQIVTTMPATPLTLDGRPVLIDERSLVTLGRSPDRARRKAVYDAYWERYARQQELFSATLNASLHADLLKARTHRYKSVLEFKLSETNIPLDVFRTAATEVGGGLPILHRYYDWLKRRSGLSDFRLYDRGLPVSLFEGRYSLVEMRQLMLAAVRPLGPEYQHKLSAALLANWMDTAPRPGKRSGNYTNFTIYDVHPYLLLNLGTRFSDLTLFTHEWGHAMHSVLANAAQPYELARYPVFVAEIASTHNELLLARYLINASASREERLFYLSRLLQLFVTVFFNNAMLTMFESQIQEAVERGDGLSGQSMTDVYLGLQQRFFGSSVATDRAYALDWARVAQFYDAFYSFQYVTALTASVHFSDTVLAHSDGAEQRYLDLLRAGGSGYGYDLIAAAGVDLAKPQPYRALIDHFEAVLNEATSL